jgi:hypothetical protein
VVAVLSVYSGDVRRSILWLACASFASALAWALAGLQARRKALTQAFGSSHS